MLPKKYRLPVQSTLSLKGKVYRSRYFLCKVFSPERDYNRASVIVGAAVDPRATARNRLRRLAYRAIAPLLQQASRGDYLVILQRASAEEGASNGIIKELQTIFR